jgi:DHA3 family macrolide efflux protein-like MFS transporter
LQRGDSYQAVFANRDFRALWFSRILGTLGWSMSYVAVALYVFELTGDASGVSFALAMELLPWVLVGPMVGLLADRFDRKFLLVGGYALKALFTGMLPFAQSTGQIYLLVFLGGLMSPVVDITRSAALPGVLGTDLFVRGASLDIMAITSMEILGPPLGGWLVTLTGARPVFGIVVLCFGAAALSSGLANLPVSGTRRTGGLFIQIAWEDFRTGVVRIGRSPLLRYLLLVTCLATSGWAAIDVALVAYVKDSLGLSGGEYGLVRGVSALSLTIGVYVLGRYLKSFSRRRLWVGGVLFVGVTFFAMAIRPGLPLLIALWFLKGFGWAGYWLVDNAYWAEATGDQERGRIYSQAWALAGLAESMTALLGGWLTTRFGPAAAMVILGGLMFFGTLALSLATSGYRALGELERRTEASVSEP